MRDVSTHPSGDQDGSGGEEMNRVDLVTRRTFLGGVFSAGALVLGARLLPANGGAAFAETSAVSGADGAAWQPSVYLGIETDGTEIIVACRTATRACPIADSRRLLMMSNMAFKPRMVPAQSAILVTRCAMPVRLRG